MIQERGMNETKPENIKTAYERICTAHDQIADFRAKLLALLPIASGAGILFLVSDKKPANELLIPVGIFGALITIGLFFYELRGIQKCRGLIACARKLEKELTPNLWKYGAFNFRQGAAIEGFIGAAGAALIIYPTVISGWIYIGALGLIKSEISALWFFIEAWLVSFVLGFWHNQWQRKSLKATLEKIEKKE